jgi:hypothetical protein
MGVLQLLPWPVVLVSHNLHAPRKSQEGKLESRQQRDCSSQEQSQTKQLQLSVPGDDNRARKSMSSIVQSKGVSSYKPEEPDTNVRLLDKKCDAPWIGYMHAWNLNLC